MISMQSTQVKFGWDDSFLPTLKGRTEIEEGLKKILPLFDESKSVETRLLQAQETLIDSVFVGKVRQDGENAIEMLLRDGERLPDAFNEGLKRIDLSA